MTRMTFTLVTDCEINQYYLYMRHLQTPSLSTDKVQQGLSIYLAKETSERLSLVCEPTNKNVGLFLPKANVTSEILAVLFLVQGGNTQSWH